MYIYLFLLITYTEKLFYKKTTYTKAEKIFDNIRKTSSQYNMQFNVS